VCESVREHRKGRRDEREEDARPPTVWPRRSEHCSVASPRRDASGTMAMNEMMKSAVEPQ